VSVIQAMWQDGHSEAKGMIRIQTENDRKIIN